jgi:hypothetical protein
MSHAMGTLDENLWFGQIFIGPIHSQSKGVTLVVDTAESLTTKGSCVW